MSFVEINYDAVPRTIVIKISEEFRGRELPEDHMEHVEDAKCGKIVIGFRVPHTTHEVFDAVVTYPFDWRTIFQIFFIRPTHTRTSKLITWPINIIAVEPFVARGRHSHSCIHETIDRRVVMHTVYLVCRFLEKWYD